MATISASIRSTCSKSPSLFPRAMASNCAPTMSQSRNVFASLRALAESCRPTPHAVAAALRPESAYRTAVRNVSSCFPIGAPSLAAVAGLAYPFLVYWVLAGQHPWFGLLITLVALLGLCACLRRSVGAMVLAIVGTLALAAVTLRIRVANDLAVPASGVREPGAGLVFRPHAGARTRSADHALRAPRTRAARHPAVSAYTRRLTVGLDGLLPAHGGGVERRWPRPAPTRPGCGSPRSATTSAWRRCSRSSMSSGAGNSRVTTGFRRGSRYEMLRDALRDRAGEQSEPIARFAMLPLLRGYEPDQTVLFDRGRPISAGAFCGWRRPCRPACRSRDSPSTSAKAARNFCSRARPRCSRDTRWCCRRAGSRARATICATSIPTATASSMRRPVRTILRRPHVCAAARTRTCTRGVARSLCGRRR